jgi:hypothetical protein
MLWLKMSMNINQIIELWRGLSPHLARAIPGQELSTDEYIDRKKSTEYSKDKIVDPIGSHHEEDDV